MQTNAFLMNPMTFFARDYTAKAVSAFTYLFFDMWNILAFIGTISGLVLFVKKGEVKIRMIGGAMFVIFGAATWYFYTQAQASNDIQPEVLQSFNPLFIVSLTFLLMGIFTWLSDKGKGPRGGPMAPITNLLPVLSTCLPSRR